VTAIEVRDGDHPMLRRARLWHAIAAEFARSALDRDPEIAGASAAGAGAAGDVAAAVAAQLGDQRRVVL
jgi:hypothetical protein